MQFLLLMVFLWGGGKVFKSFASSIEIVGLRVPTRNLQDVPLFHACPFFKTVPPPGVPLQHIQFVAVLISFEGKLPHQGLVKFYITSCCYELFKYSHCFICVLFIVLCYLCLYVVLFLLLVIQLLTRKVSKQDFKRILSTLVTHSSQVRY